MAKANLFSAVTGVLTQNGQPQAGVTIRRSVTWRGEEHADSVVTDAAGRYEFPALISDANLPKLPAEFNAFQTMVAEVGGEDVLLWDTVKAEPVADAELDGLPLKFQCELNDPLRFEHLLLNSIETRCRW